MKAYNNIYQIEKENRITRVFIILFIVIVVILFLPWTQSIQANGYVTTLNTEERPQEIQSVIAGKISQWRVKEGDFVKTGDTIAILTEIKSEYLNPELLKQTEIQIQAKENSLLSYNSNATTIHGFSKAYLIWPIFCQRREALRTRLPSCVRTSWLHRKPNKIVTSPRSNTPFVSS